MIFTFSKWEEFCKNLSDKSIYSICACDVGKEKYLVLKHDVETNVQNALNMAIIENKYGHKGSYYVQAYLLKDAKNIEMLKKIQTLGHEVSYHYDVLDSCKGDVEKADIEFLENKIYTQEFVLLVSLLISKGKSIDVLINSKLLTITSISPVGIFKFLLSLSQTCPQTLITLSLFSVDAKS